MQNYTLKSDRRVSDPERSKKYQKTDQKTTGCRSVIHESVFDGIYVSETATPGGGYSHERYKHQSETEKLFK